MKYTNPCYFYFLFFLKLLTIKIDCYPFYLRQTDNIIREGKIWVGVTLMDSL
jgi:hypothetical protein